MLSRLLTMRFPFLRHQLSGGEYERQYGWSGEEMTYSVLVDVILDFFAGRLRVLQRRSLCCAEGENRWGYM